jgi:hypothetical protein
VPRSRVRAYLALPPDADVKLPTGDGRELDTVRISRTLDDVDRLGETLYLMVPCPVPLSGEGPIPVRAVATAADDAAETTYVVRLAAVRSQS